MNWLLVLIAQADPAAAAEAAPAAIPAWGWITIVSTLASAVASLAALYKGARDREVAVTEKLAASEASKVDLVQKIGQRTAELLEKAIEAFTLNKTNNEQLAARLQEQAGAIGALNDEMRRTIDALSAEVRRMGEDVEQEVRRVGEKIKG